MSVETIERRKAERRAAEAREERTYTVARRRILALEKALDLLLGSLNRGDYSINASKVTQYRQGIDVARSLLGVRPSDE